MRTNRADPWTVMMVLLCCCGGARAALSYPVAVDLVQSFHKLLQMPGVPAMLASHTNDTKYIFDVGFNNGDDTQGFIMRGYTVVGVDADPNMIAQGMTNFREYIAQHKLLLLHAGIEEMVTNSLVFWKNTQVPVLSSFERKKACDDDGHKWKCEAIDVPLLRCEALFAFGRPEYLKVDIEERHFACIKALKYLPRHLLPKYVSWEMHEFAKGMPYPLMDTQLIFTLWELGYTWIKVVAQAEGHKSSSFPDEAENYMGNENWWSKVEDVLQRGLVNPRALQWSRYDDYHRKNITYSPWFDFHMRLDPDADRTSMARRKALQSMHAAREGGV